MVKRVATAAAMLACALAAATTAHADPRTIYILNASTTVTDAEVANALPAFQAAADQDFAPEWGTSAHLVQIPAGETPPGQAWTITIADTSDVVGAAGYHWLNQHTPYAKVFTDNDLPWQLIFTHELFEMLADPYCDRAAAPAVRNHRDGTIYALEVADPVEAETDAYARPGADGAPVTISDFVTERWFDGQGGGRFDFTGHLRHAGQVAPDGYVISFSRGAWRSMRTTPRSASGSARNQ